MPELRAITIIGGGLAGLTLGIGLRQRGIPVSVHEAGAYPRHRVCGEFISGGGQGVLARLGLEQTLVEAGAVTATTAVFFLGKFGSPVRPLPVPALCISRYVLDALLAEAFKRSGGELHEGQRWRESEGGEGIVRASGRRLQPVEAGWRWFGLKAHARNVPLAADLEMHGLPDRYVGLCRLPGGEVNVCGLFRRRRAGGEVAPWPELLRGPAGSKLREQLAEAVFDEKSFCSVAGLSLRPARASSQRECCIGDALTMIPPVTGNGMSMAFESAWMACEPLAAWSRGEIAWPEAQQRVARACDRAFARRLTWARWLQWMMFAPSLQRGLGAVVLRSGWLWRRIFSWTR